MKKILIIEDQADVRELIRMTLEIEDFDIHEADNGDAGLSAARGLRPDLVLLDVMMPGPLDGFAVCSRLKGDPALGPVKVIILSAKGQASDRRQGEAAGADDHLSKPFSPRQLLDMVASHLV